MLRRFLPTVVANTPQTEARIIVADNGSTDDSMAVLASDFPSVEVIPLDQNYGFAEGYNQALKRVRGEVDAYLLLNSDVETPPGWLAPLTDYMERHPDVAACQPKLRAEHTRSQFEYAGAAGGFIDAWGYPFCRGRIFDTVERDNGQYDYATEILWATGAALMIRSKDYWDAGGLDGRFFAHNEEIDLCWRLRIRGRKIYCLPESYVYHVGGGTLPKSNPMKTFLNFRNNLTMLYKCLPDSELRYVMCWRWFLDYLAAWQTLLLKGNWGDFRAIYRARRAYKRWKKDFSADRTAIQQSRVVEDIPGQYHFSVLWQYYAKGHKFFSEL